MTDDEIIASLSGRYEVAEQARGLPVDQRLADLCAALLESAIADLHGRDTSSHGSRATRRRQAQAWIMGESGCHPLVRFSTCCAVMGLDEQAARARLMEVRWWCGGRETETPR